MRLFYILLPLVGLLALPNPTGMGARGLLWRVVQSCVLNHNLTGGSFPCLTVETADGVERGYAVLRPPQEDSHVIVTPTARTIGIEDSKLRGSGAPNYFRDAWAARKFVIEDLGHKPKRDDLALAVNSRPGRSQDQLHIHVGCIRRDVKQVLTQLDNSIRDHDVARLKVLPGAPAYWAHFEPSPDLASVNIFDQAAEALGVEPAKMADVTIVVVGAAPTGFLVLARQRLPRGFDEPHGEALLDVNCNAFRAP